MLIGLLSSTSSRPPRRNWRSDTPLPNCQRPLNDAICGCNIGTPVVMRVTSMPASRSRSANAARNSFGPAISRASVISHWMIESATASVAVTGSLGGKVARERALGGFAMLRPNMTDHQPQRSGEHCGIVCEAEQRQHVRHEIKRQDEIGQRADQRDLNVARRVAIERAVICGEQILGEWQPHGDSPRLCPEITPHAALFALVAHPIGCLTGHAILPTLVRWQLRRGGTSAGVARCRGTIHFCPNGGVVNHRMDRGALPLPGPRNFKGLLVG